MEFSMRGLILREIGDTPFIDVGLLECTAPDDGTDGVSRL